MNHKYGKIVGYYANYKGTQDLLCDGDSCVIAGSADAMKVYIRKLAQDNPKDYHIRKTRFAEIMQGMQMGGVYSFDRKAYSKFLPILRLEGKNLAEFKSYNDSKPYADAVRLMRVKWFDMR